MKLKQDDATTSYAKKTSHSNQEKQVRKCMHLHSRIVPVPFAPSPANTLVLFKNHRLIPYVHKSRTERGCVETKYRILGNWIQRDNWRYFTSLIVKPHLVQHFQYMCRPLNPGSTDGLPLNETNAVIHDKPKL